MNTVETMLARAQINLAYFFALGFVGILIGLMFFSRQMNETATTLLTGLLGVFGTIATQQSSFFFARMRSPALPDPGTTTTSIQSTTPAPTAPQPGVVS